MRIFIFALLLLSFSLPQKATPQSKEGADSPGLILKTEPLSEVKIDSLLLRSEKLIDNHYFRDAQKHLDSALLLSKRIGYRAGITGFYDGMGSLYLEEENSEKALENYNASLAIGMKSGDSLHVARSCLKISRVYNYFDDFANAVLYLKRALRIAEAANEKQLEKLILDKLSVVYTFLENYPEAIVCIERAKAIAVESGNTAEVIKSEMNLAIIYKYQQNYTKALEIFLRERPFFEKSGDKEVLIPLDNCIGSICFHRKDYSAALKHLQSAYKMSMDLGLKPKAAENLAIIAEVYREQNRFPAAQEAERQVLDIYTSLDDKKGIGGTWLAIGETWLAQGNLREAMQSYEKSLRFCEEAEDKYNRARCLNAMADVIVIRARSAPAELALSDFDKANALYRESLYLSKFMGQYDRVMNIYHSLFTLDSTTGNYRDALENFLHYSECKDSLYSIESSRKLAQLQVQFIQDQKNREIDLLTKESEIKSLQMKNQQTELLASKLETDRNQSQILFLVTSRKLQDLQLEKTARELDDKNSAFLKKEAELRSTRQIKDLREKEVRRQKMQRNGIAFTSILLLLTAIFIIRTLVLKKRLEKQQAVSKERERISADLHDDIGSGLSKIILMLEVLTKEAETDTVREKSKALSQESLELSRNMSEVIWALNSRYDSLESLAVYIRKYGSAYFENTSTTFRMTAPSHTGEIHLSGEQRRNLFYVVKEALHNIVKHAKATEAEILLSQQDHSIELVIRDNGTGICAEKQNQFGNGLIQMRNRINSIGGEFSCETDRGVRIKIILPV